MKLQPSKNAKISIIPRSEIPSLHKIEIKGEMHNLGVLKDLRKHPELATFIPDNARLSVSWVNLQPDETLSVHEHPTASMIVICEGEGEILGDCKQLLKAGDIAAIPPDNKHGFVGRGEQGFWGLSVQFEGLGLYENREDPRVHFIDSKRTEAGEKNNLDDLLHDQSRYLNLYKKSNLLKLLQSDDIQDPMVQERLLEALNHWGNLFQRIIFARGAKQGGLAFQRIAEEHIMEEIGHNNNLLIARGNKPIQLWSPALDAVSSWFYEKMLSNSDAERTVLVHFVLEGSGEVFHKEAAKIFTHIDHFREHGEVEDEHFGMGVQLLKEMGGINVESLRHILQQGWDMMEVLSSSIAHLAIGKNEGRL